jgi:3-phenylpropionate/cinnamic acid dioxygenase small subunit
MLRDMESTMHFIGNVLIELTGADAARAESYFTAYHRIAGPTDMIVAGRYLDRFTRRAGEWRIAHRAAVYDYNITQPASDAAWGAPEMQAVLARGKRAPDDASCRDLAL